jgi:hypothetical protein
MNYPTYGTRSETRPGQERLAKAVAQKIGHASPSLLNPCQGEAGQLDLFQNYNLLDRVLRNLTTFLDELDMVSSGAIPLRKSGGPKDMIL